MYHTGVSVNKKIEDNFAKWYGADEEILNVYRFYWRLQQTTYWL